MEFGYIYKITNLINKKMYIGQTRTRLEERWRKHKDRFYLGEIKTGLYGAMHKYGIENFIIEPLITCPIEDLDDMEIFYINKFDTYNNGYNLTIGGQNGSFKSKFTDQEVINQYAELKSIKATAYFFNSSERTISNILKKNNITLINPSHWTKGNAPRGNIIPPIQNKPIIILELNKQFNSMMECGQWLIDNGYSKASTAEMAMKSISRVINGERKTYCKLHFERS